MRTKIEGILLSKTPFKERDLIGQLLLRSGKKVSVLFYGGQGGGKRMKSCVLGPGNLLSVEVNPFRRQQNQGFYLSREYSLKWHHQNLRNHHQAFYLLCFYLEILSRVALEDDLGEGEGGRQAPFGQGVCEDQGAFSVLSNAIYYLDESVGKKRFEKTKHLALFLSKLVHYLGLTPRLEQCLYSHRDLKGLRDFGLVFEQGGFAENQYLSGQRGNHRGVWEMLCQSLEFSYPGVDDFLEKSPDPSGDVRVLFDYLLFQCHIPRERLKTVDFTLG